MTKTAMAKDSKISAEVMKRSGKKTNESGNFPQDPSNAIDDGDWVNENGPEGKGTDSKQPSKDLVVSRAVLHAAMGRGAGKKGGAFGKILRTHIVSFTTLQSSANTIFNTNYALVPSGGTEWSSFAAIYDECRVVGLSLHWIAYTGGQIPVFIPFGGLSFGPAVAITNTSIAAVAESTQNIVFPFVQTVGVTGSSQGTNPAKLHVWKIRLSSAPLTSSSSGVYVGGQWYPTADTSTQVGVVCPYFEAAGSSVTTNWRALVKYTVEFRSRG